MINHLHGWRCGLVALALAVCQGYVNAAQMYWGDLSNEVIWSAETHGVGAQQLIQTGSLRGVSIDERFNHLYWVKTGPNRGIYRSNLDGSGTTNVIDTEALGLNGPFGVTVDTVNDKLYWLPTGGGLYRSELDGSNNTKIIDQTDFAFAQAWGILVVPSRNELYWTDQVGITRSDLDGGNIVNLVRGPLVGGETKRDMAIDLVSNKLFLAHGNAIERVNLDGTGLETIVTHTDFGNPTGIYVHDEKLYWTQPANSENPARIRRSDLDGSGIKTLITMDDGGFTSIVVAGVEGDLNGDGFVGISDLNIVLSNWNADAGVGNAQPGDLTGDGFVGIDDLNKLLGNWNVGTPPMTTVMPEPAALTLLLLGGSPLIYIGRQRAAR